MNTSRPAALIAFVVFHKDSETGQVSDIEILAASADDAIRKAIELARKFGNELQPYELGAEEA